MNKEVKKKEGEAEEDKRKTRRCGGNEAAGQQVVEELGKMTAGGRGGKQEGQTGSDEETRNKSDKEVRGKKKVTQGRREEGKKEVWGRGRGMTGRRQETLAGCF